MTTFCKGDFNSKEEKGKSYISNTGKGLTTLEDEKSLSLSTNCL